MPYIGVSPFNGVRKKHTYTATASQTSFSGAGAESITLSYKDSTFVDVFQNGVKLGEADYTATSGTAIVLAQGASLNDIIEVVVYDVFSVADTVSKADGGTFDGAVTLAGGVSGDVAFDTNTLKVDSSNNRVGIGTASPDSLLTVESSGATTAKLDTSSSSSYAELIIEDGNAGYALQTRSDNAQSTSNGSFMINDRDTGTFPFIIAEGNPTNSFVMSNNGSITMANQPAFSVELTSEAENKTGNATGFQLGSLGSTERFDRNGDVSNFLFTAPVDGLYLISIMIMYDGFGSANSGFAQIQTSNRIYQCALYNPVNSSNVGVNHQIVATYLCDMDANDTAQPLLYINGAGSDSVDLQATETRMSGILVA